MKRVVTWISILGVLGMPYQGTCYAQSRTVVITDMRTGDGQPIADPKVAKKLEEGLKSFGVAKPDDKVVLDLKTSTALGYQALATKQPAYTDKNGYFTVIPPTGWVKKEFNDPRSKVSFDVPAPIAGQNRAGLFFLSHPLSGEIDVRAEAENRVARLKKMGSPDARVTTVDFAGVKAEQVEGQMGRQNVFLRALMFTNYGRNYTISFTATKQDFAQYWPIADESLKTFKCIPLEGVAVAADKETVQKQKIRVWIAALKDPDLGTDAFSSLLAIGQPAILQLEEAKRTGTLLQQQRAADLIKQIRTQGQ